MSRPLRVAVIGAGPAGVYAADALITSGTPVSIDVFDRLPTPYGLVRYGVAPDHPKTKAICEVLRRTLDNPAVRFLGNVSCGLDLYPGELRQYYDAVLFAIGADDHRSLGIPGEGLPGSCSATEFVAWYNAHPYATEAPRHLLDARSVAVIGAGNVALDAARILLTGADRLAESDVPTRVLADLRHCAVTDVHLLARRGPAQARFTIPELREIGQLDDVDVLVDPAAVALAAGDSAAVRPGSGSPMAPADRRRVRVCVDLLAEWAHRPAGGASRRIHFSFWQHPVAIEGTGRVESVRIASTRPGTGNGQPAASAVSAPVVSTLRVQAVLRAIGYRGRPIAGLPFDTATSTVPNDAGRVIDGGVPLPGRYVAGWIKRGPTGVIGTNKADAAETVRCLLADAPGLPRAACPDPEAVTELLTRRGTRYVTWAEWQRLDAYEIDHGRRRGRARAKVADLGTMLDICHPSRRPPTGAESRQVSGSGGVGRGTGQHHRALKTSETTAHAEHNV